MYCISKSFFREDEDKLKSGWSAGVHVAVWTVDAECRIGKSSGLYVGCWRRKEMEGVGGCRCLHVIFFFFKYLFFISFFFFNFKENVNKIIYPEQKINYGII